MASTRSPPRKMSGGSRDLGVLHSDRKHQVMRDGAAQSAWSAERKHEAHVRAMRGSGNAGLDGQRERKVCADAPLRKPKARPRGVTSAQSHVAAAVLGPGKSLVDAVKELKDRVAESEENARREKQQRLALQGQLQGTEAELVASRANAKQLENLIAKLNHEDRELRLALEQDAKRIEDLEFAKNAALQIYRGKAQTAELERKAAKAVSAAEAATAKLREEQALQGSLRAQCREAQTMTRVAKELQAEAEARAARAERALVAEQARTDAALQEKSQLEIEVSASRDSINELRYQVKTASAQRDELIANKADLEAQVEALRRELDAISSLFLVK